MENKQALFTLLSANVVSGFATGISMLAIPWYFTINGYAAEFGILYATVTFFSLFWNLYAGSLIDKHSRKTLFIWISSVSGIVLLSVAISGFLTGHTSIILIGLVFVATIFNYNIHFGALYAFGQEISPPAYYGRISSYLEIQNQSTSVLSGGVAVILLSGVGSGEALNFIGMNLNIPVTIEAWSMEEIFLLDAITYSIAIVLVSTIRYKPVSARPKETGTVISRIQSGFMYLREHPKLFKFGILSHAIFVVLLVEVLYLVPIYIDKHLNEGADVYASSEILYSLGALFAGISIRKIFLKLKTVNSIIILQIISAAIFFLVSFTKEVSIFYAFSFLIGITNAGARVLRVAYIFKHIPNNIIGRTNGIFNLINILLRSTFIGIFAFAWFSEGSNITIAYFICGSFVLVSGFILWIDSKKLPDKTA
jgi:MFS transporter, DHA3 family, macrolide efflux protein